MSGFSLKGTFSVWFFIFICSLDHAGPVLDSLFQVPRKPGPPMPFALEQAKF